MDLSSSRRARATQRGGRRLSIGVVAVAIAMFAVLGLRHAGALLVVSAPLKAPDAIISLASHEWERLPAAATLASQYPTSVLLLTVPAQVTEHNCHDCAGRVAWLVHAGVSRRRIRMLGDPVTNTYDEATASLAYARQEKISGLLIVTSPYHTRRALAVFRQVFASSPVRIGIHPTTSESPATPERWWRHRYDLRYVGYEWAARLFYLFRFGLSPLDVETEVGRLPPFIGTDIEGLPLRPGGPEPIAHYFRDGFANIDRG